jgi:hypothetical protein
MRFDTASLVRLGLLPAGFNQVDAPALVDISDSPGPSTPHPPTDADTSVREFNAVRFEPNQSWIGNKLGEMAQFTVKAKRAFRSRFESVSSGLGPAIGIVVQTGKKNTREIRSRFTLTLRRVQSTVSPLAERAFEVRRGTLVFLSVLVCICGTVRFWKPLVQWLGTLPAAVPIAVPIRGEIVRPENGSSQMNTESQLTTGRTPIDRTHIE